MRLRTRPPLLTYLLTSPNRNIAHELQQEARCFKIMLMGSSNLKVRIHGVIPYLRRAFVLFTNHPSQRKTDAYNPGNIIRRRYTQQGKWGKMVIRAQNVVPPAFIFIGTIRVE